MTQIKEIEDMNFKELRTEVQLLRDEIARMKRFYEDLLYNLDNDNFSGQFLAKQNNMQTQIKVNAEGIETTVKKTDELSDELTNAYTQIKQSATKIEHIATRTSGLEGEVESLDSYIKQTAESISSEVSKKINLSVATFVESEADRTDKNKIYAISDGNGGYTFYCYNTISGEWEKLRNDTIYSFFEQTTDGFQLKGNVQINGNLVKSTDGQGNAIEINKGFLNIIPNGSEKPKLQMGFTESDSYENPYILIGAGDGKFESTLSGIPFKSSTGLIYKNANGMLLSYTTGTGEAMGIQFLEEDAMKFYGNIDFSDADSVFFGDKATAVAVFG